MPQKKLYLLDAFALIYRAYYALIQAPRITSKGLNTSAIFGFCNTLDEVLRHRNPSHIAVCFDPPGKTFRHEVYADYKAQREAQPEDITRSIPYIKEIIKAYNIPVIEIPGYEADDVIGTLSRIAEAQGYDTYMMTPDKDYGQLVTDHVWMYRPSLRGEGFEIRGPKEVCERYGIETPLQVIDLLALEGDTSDNIPGVAGIGPKIAQKLVRTYDSVEGVIAQKDNITGKLGERIRANVEQIRFSKMLATIKTDVPLDVNLDSMVRQPENVERLLEIYTELEFRSFIRRLTSRLPEGGVSSKAPEPKEGEMGSLFDLPDEGAKDGITMPLATLADTPHEFHIVASVEEAGEVVKKLSAHEFLGLDIYAPGEDAMSADMKGIAVATSAAIAYYFPVPPAGTERDELMQVLEPLFAEGVRTFCSHDIKRCYLLLKRDKIEWGVGYFDTAVAHYVLEPEISHRLSGVVGRMLAYNTMDAADNVRRPMREQKLSEQSAADLFCEAALMSLRLREPLIAALREHEQESLLNDIEFPLIRVLAEMEWTGVRIDTAHLAELSRVFSKELHDMVQEAYRLAGERFNTGSPSQVGEILFGKMQIDPKAKKTKKGAYSTTEEILEKYRRSVPLVDLILRIRAKRKLLATYIDTLPQLINPVTGKIHTTYNQTVTATGRISSTNPNLQNIPIRSDDGREIRRAFIADPGCLIMSADYSQIELRLIADLSGDRDMVEAFLSGKDIHRATAARIYGVPLEEVTEDQRRNAKTANFGIIYGISAFGLSERLGIPRSEAKMLIDGYFSSYPHIREYIDKAVERAREDGYVTTIKGRKRYLPDINSRNGVVRSYAERNAVNAPIQGSAADIIKIAMVNVYRRIQEAGLRSRMIMQVHDELIFNVVEEELPRLQSIVAECMEQAYGAKVPLEVSSGVGANWLEAH